MIELKNVSKFYYQNGMIASGFSRINVKFNIGEFVVITGESGSGKSTLLNVISGLDSYEEGEMYINGEETSHYTEKDFEYYRRKYIGNIFQNFNLINSYTVYQNVELILLLNGEQKRKIKKRVLEIIDTVGLLKFKNTKVSKLSGGQKQRVAIARVLAKDTPIVVADEPTGNLDTTSANQIMELLHKISKNKLVIIVTHNKEQVEKYASRLIQMHDGKILEDKTINKVEKDISLDIKDFKNITIFNRLRLGIRNTFNIIPKLLLILTVFLFISLTLIFEYSTMKKTEDKIANAGSNYLFINNDNKRIIVKKKDSSMITNEDLSSLDKVNHINYVVHDDVLLDNYSNIQNNEGQFFGGNISTMNLFEGNVDFGRMPSADDEIIVLASAYEWALTENYDSILEKEFDLLALTSGYKNDYIKVKVVGIKKSSDSLLDHSTFYVSDSIIDKIRFSTNQQYSDISILFADKYYKSIYYNPYFNLLASPKVPKGEAYISEDEKYMCKNENCYNYDIKVEIKNIYYNQDLNLKVKKYYNKKDYNNVIGVGTYEDNNGTVFISVDDYNNLFNKDSYQSSVFVDDVKNVELVKSKLNELGYITLAIKDTLVDTGHEAAVMLQLFTNFFTIVLIIALFFISYFVIKIILKSRSIYFTTIRILGATKKISKQILNIELFTTASVSYVICLSLIYLVKVDIIHVKQIANLLPFITRTELIVVYVILIVLSQLISNRFARKIFKKTVMKTYREEE